MQERIDSVYQAQQSIGSKIRNNTLRITAAGAVGVGVKVIGNKLGVAEIAVPGTVLVAASAVSLATSWTNYGYEQARAFTNKHLPTIRKS